MKSPTNVSELSHDRLIDLLFTVMPSVEPEEITMLLVAIIEIMSDEVQQAVEAERERMLKGSEN